MRFTPAPATTDSGIAFIDGLATHGEAVALIHRGEPFSYARLSAMADEIALRLGDRRRLVQVHGANSPHAIAGYLGALRAGSPVLLGGPADSAAARTLSDAYDPDVVLGELGDEPLFNERRSVSAHELHRDLALLLSTSGTTGSPKLVRLSRENVNSNAAAIAEYLAIGASDRAATTLPMHYCYGLSVIHSHLLRGAGLLLTDLSVVDECFWRDFKEHRATSFAGVPHTFELLERTGFAERDLPDLSYVTQAGGRLEPARVRRFAELGRERGWQLFVMYGQTEATARMAYLPPALASGHAGAIGVPVPGGSFSIEPPAGETSLAADGSGELVFRGPNVMLGYAEQPADLALGRTVDELRTGDLARRNADGLYEVTGRLSRFVKIFGLRVDLQRAEALLADRGVTTCCSGADDELVVAYEGPAAPREIRQVVATELGLAPGAVRAVSLAVLPRLASGKTDTAAVIAATQVEPAGGDVVAAADGLTALFAEVLDIDRAEITPQSTFVSLGGDSLSYVEMSVALEHALGELPAGWHVTPIEQLKPVAAAGRRRGQFVETSVLLRALGIVLIVGSHAGLFKILGAAHILIAVAGFNFARFMLGREDQTERIRGILRGAGRIVVPTVIWISFAAVLLTDQYESKDVLMLDAIFGPSHWTPQWHFWFVEVLVYMLVLSAALFAIPAAHRAERRWQFAFPLALVAWGLVLRFEVVELGITITKPVLWLFALGWAAARAGAAWQRALVSLIAVLAVPSYFGDFQREAVITAGLLLLVWCSGLRVPKLASRAAVVVASASLYIYLTHWQVFRQMLDYPLLGVASSITVGVAYWLIATKGVTALREATARLALREASAAAFVLICCAVAAGLSAGFAAPTASASSVSSDPLGTAIDSGHVYWIRSEYIGESRSGSFRYRSKLVQRNLSNGTERVIFSTTRSGIDALHAGAGRVTFTARYEARNARRRTYSKIDRIYAMNADAISPELIAKLGGTMRESRSSTAFSSLCLGFGYGENISMNGTILTREQPNTCGHKDQEYRSEFAGYQPDASRTVLLADGLSFHGAALENGKLYSFGEDDLTVTDPSDAVTSKSPIDDWIEFLDFEAGRAVAIRSDDDFDERSSFVWFDPVTLSPIRRVYAKRGQLLQPRLCDSGYVIVTGRVRRSINSGNYQQPLGRFPHVATFYTYDDQPLRSVRLPNRGIHSLECAGDNLILMMDGRNNPLVKVVPFG